MLNAFDRAMAEIDRKAAEAAARFLAKKKAGRKAQLRALLQDDAAVRRYVGDDINAEISRLKWTLEKARRDIKRGRGAFLPGLLDIKDRIILLRFFRRMEAKGLKA